MVEQGWYCDSVTVINLELVVCDYCFESFASSILVRTSLYRANEPILQPRSIRRVFL